MPQGATILTRLCLIVALILYYYIFMIKNYEKQIEELPSDFKMSDKQTLILIKDLFEMVKDNHKLIGLLDKRVKILELRLKN